MAALNLQDMLINLSHSYYGISKLVSAFSFVIGMGMAVKAIYHLKVYGEMRTMQSGQANLREPLTYLLVSAVLLYLPSTIDAFLMTTFGSTDVTPLSYFDAGSPSYQRSFEAILGFVQLIGYISFIRGWMMISHGQQIQQRGGYGKALTHIFGGVLAINIVGTKQIIWNTFGF